MLKNLPILAISTLLAVSCATNRPNLTLTKVTANVYSAIGVTNAPSYENAGHNNNLSFIVTTDGVLVVNGGDNYLLAKALHASIAKVTDQPVRYVVNENGQGHSFLGNSYWFEQGVPAIAHEAAVQEIEKHGPAILKRMQGRSKDKAQGTFVAVPTHTFTDKKELVLGETRIELISFGDAHSPGDISVWLPREKVIITGDIAFHERLLAIFPDTHVAAWIESFERMTQLNPQKVIPGHGHPTNVATIRQYTQGYLQFLVREVNKILEDDGDLGDAYAIDQSAYAHLNTFEELAVKNAGRLFQTMELDFF